MNDVTFTRGQGGLSKPIPGEDHISALLFYIADGKALPSGYGTDRVKQIIDAPHALQLGIVNDKSDEVNASGGKVVITTPGAAASIASISMDGVVLGSYHVVLNDTNDQVATGLRAAINAGTSGYVAAGTTANITLTPPTGLGSTINAGTHLSFASTGTGAATVTQFTGGIDAFYDVAYYHIDEFFRLNPGATLYVGLFENGSDDFTEIKTMQDLVEGKIRQMGVFSTAVFASADITKIKAVYADCSVEHKPLTIGYAADISAVSDLTTLPDLSTLDSEKVSVIIGQDGANVGAALFADKGYSISCLGATLGAVSLAKVSECIGWVAKFNMANASLELDTPAIANGTLVKTLSDNFLNAINTKRYIFLRKHIGITGSYFNDSHTATSATSDYSSIEANRTMDKAERNVRTNLLPQLNAPVPVDASTGKLRPDMVAYLEQLGQRALDDMAANEELSGAKVIINPEQDIIRTSKITVVIANVPIGVSRNFDVQIGYVTKL